MVKATLPRRVLVVDDDEDMVRGLELYLKLEGLDVSCALGGATALKELEESPPSAVILDILMPDLDGLQVCRYVRDVLGYEDTPVIVLSAVSDSRCRQELLEAGANEYLTKPCDFARVFDTVLRYVA